MLIVGALVVRAGRLGGWRKLPPFVCGVALPVFVLLTAAGAPQGVAAASFDVLTMAGFGALGVTLFASTPKMG